MPALIVTSFRANGVNYNIPVGGIWQKVSGTSAATPVVASIFALINGARMNAGKGTDCLSYGIFGDSHFWILFRTGGIYQSSDLRTPGSLQ